MQQFMVTVSLPSELTEEFFSLVPQQPALVNQLFNQGKLTSYSLALDRSRLWATLTTESEEEVVHIVSLLPLRKYMKVEIHHLAFHQNTMHNLARISMN
jgi:muconolactone delta-isomerase